MAINIALMGFLLIEGILAHLKHADPNADGASLRDIANQIAAGNLSAHGMLARDALVHGFHWVMLYGGAGAWLLAAASFVTFGSTRTAPAALQCCATDSGSAGR